MADDTTEGSASRDGGPTPDPDATRKDAAQKDDQVSTGTAGDAEAGSTDPTEQWAPLNTDEHPRAYSAVPDAPTTPVIGPEAVGYPAADYRAPGTTRFPTGESPVPESGPIPDGAAPAADIQTGPEVVTTAPGRRRTGLIIALCSVGVILVLVIAAVGSELYFRNRATNCLEQQFNSLTGQSTSVSLSNKPVLLQYISGSFPYVQVDTNDSDDTKTRLHLRADNLTESGDSVKIASLTGTGYVSFQRVIEMSKQSGGLTGGSGNGTGNGNSGNGTGNSGGDVLAGTQIDSVVGNAADGTIKVNASVPVAIFSVPITLTVKPVVTAGKVTFEVQQASAFALGIPADFAQQFVDGFGNSLFGDLTDAVEVQSLKVTDSGVDFSVTGTDVDLNQASGGSGSQMGAQCAVF